MSCQGGMSPAWIPNSCADGRAVPKATDDTAVLGFRRREGGWPFVVVTMDPSLVGQSSWGCAKMYVVEPPGVELWEVVMYLVYVYMQL